MYVIYILDWIIYMDGGSVEATLAHQIESQYTKENG